MNGNKPKQFPLKATLIAVSVALGASSVVLAEGVADKPHQHATDTNEISWQETKRSAADYWQDFKQDGKQTWSTSKDAFRDGWVEGKLQTAIVLNRHLNPFDIDISVDNNTASLEGQVDTAIQKELAAQLALGIEGIDEVDNQLKVEKAKEGSKVTDSTEAKNRDEARKFGKFVEDAMLTADLKTDLIATDAISALDINIDVYRSEVTLTGMVGSEAEKDLAEKIVENNPDVTGVNNHLKIES